VNILALDLGTRTGWAALVNDRRESGVQVFDVRRGESPGMRYLRFNAWLVEFVLHRLQIVVYEQTHHRGGAATEVAAGFATRVQEFCARARIDHYPVHSATLKKFATGHGNAKKPDMIRAAAKLKPGLTDDNEADAIWLLEYAKFQFKERP
jgi:Holliday junction resolvasome RuvABC endonuclease subunit